MLKLWTIVMCSMLTLAGCEKQPPQSPVAPPSTPPAEAPQMQDAPQPITEAPAPPTADDVKQAIGNAADVTTEYTQAKTQELIAAAKAQLSVMDDKVAALTQTATDKTQSAWASLKEQYEQKKQAAAEKIAQLKDAGSESWSKAKDNMQQAVEETKNTYDAMKKALLEDDSQPEPITTEQ